MDGYHHFGQAVLIAIFATHGASLSDQAGGSHKISTVSAIQFTLAHTGRIRQVTERFIIRVGLLATPLLCIAGAIYALALTKFDL